MFGDEKQSYKYHRYNHKVYDTHIIIYIFYWINKYILYFEEYFSNLNIPFKIIRKHKILCIIKDTVEDQE